MNFDDAFARVVTSEGGYVNDPLDPGGETRWGISKRAYPAEDIAHMTLARARELYRRDYWGPAGCDAVHDSLKYPLFDAAVNQGVTRAIKMLQHAVHETEDGILGPRTLQAVGSIESARIVFRFMAARLVAYAESPETQWKRFGRGWVRRAAEVMAA
jgi:lysozyme family protein